MRFCAFTATTLALSFVTFACLGENLSRSLPPRPTRPAQPAAVSAAPSAAPTPAQPGTSPGAEPPASAAAAAKLTQILPTKDYLEFSGLDPSLSDTIDFSANSGQLLYLAPDAPPYLILRGQLKDNVEISLNDHWLHTPGGQLEVRVPLLFEPGRLTLKVFHPGQARFEIFHWVYYWLKVPPLLRFKVREGHAITDEEEGYQARFPHQAFVQLYSDATPITVVDLDALRHANLTFRIYYPPEVESGYDAWRFIIRDARGRVVTRYSRYGSPPPFLDWRIVAGEVIRRGSYTYQINLYRNGELLEGAVNRFNTIAGGGLLDHSYAPLVQCEPREEVGYYSLSSQAANYSGLYVGGSLPFAFWNRLLVRGDFLISLHQLDPTDSLTFTRLSAGLRLIGDGDSAVLGHPYLYQLDVLLGMAGYTLNPSSQLDRFTLANIMVESRLMLWGAEHLVPWVEYGARPPSLTEQRFSVGLKYEWFIRPWSLTFGMGFAYDRFFFPDDSQLNFSVFRSVTSLAYLL